MRSEANSYVAYDLNIWRPEQWQFREINDLLQFLSDNISYWIT